MPVTLKEVKPLRPQYEGIIFDLNADEARKMYTILQVFCKDHPREQWPTAWAWVDELRKL